MSPDLSARHPPPAPSQTNGPGGACNETTILRLGERVRIGKSPRTGTIIALYDEPHGGGVSSARILFADGSTGGYAIADLEQAGAADGAA